MDRTSTPARHPARLPPGTVVGSWRIEGPAGRGAQGVVYRAVAVGDEHATPVALKLALHPADPRFAREVELLSLTSHPHVPRLLGHGAWQPPGGPRYPFLVMQWVDGVPLYEWAELHPPSNPQVRRWLAQLASALAALHARGLVHRDVKGGNILVRRADGSAVLTDFGTGLHPGAATLTPPLRVAGTPAYRSPESWLFELQSQQEPDARYHASPADDLYALGVTACRLLTGEYPEPGDPTQDEHGSWHLENVLLPAALLNDSRVDPQLRALVLRLLSVRPDQRGTAAEVTDHLEQITEHATAEPSSAAKTAAGCLRTQARQWPFLAVAIVCLALTVWTCWARPHATLEEPSFQQAWASRAGTPDSGTSRLGEDAAATSMEKAPSDSTRQGMAKEALPEPLPGQTVPDEKGRCPHQGLISLNKGCWAEIKLAREACEDLGGQMSKGSCYVPHFTRGRRPNSSPMDKP